MLSTLAVDVVATADVLFSKDPRLHQRGTAIAVLRLRGARFAVAGTHLDLARRARLRHVGELHAAIAAHVPGRRAGIVAADVNDQPGLAGLVGVDRARPTRCAAGPGGPPFTSTAADPHQTIDGIFVDRRLPIVLRRCWHIRRPPRRSDHLPVLAELELPAEDQAVAGRSVSATAEPALQRQRGVAGRGDTGVEQDLVRDAGQFGDLRPGEERQLLLGAELAGSVPVSRHHRVNTVSGLVGLCAFMKTHTLRGLGLGVTYLTEGPHRE